MYLMGGGGEPVLGKRFHSSSFTAGRHVLFALITAFLLISCATSPNGAPPHSDSNGISPKFSASGKQILAAFISGQPEAFTTLLNKEALLDRAFQDMPLDRHLRSARAKMYDQLDQSGVIMTRYNDKNSRITYVRARFIQGEYHALFRIHMGDRGLSYLDFILREEDDGTVKIIDWHDYTQGTLYSEALRQALILMLPRDDSLFAEILGEAWADRDAIDLISELSDLSLANNYNQWLIRYHALPERLKYNRTILVTRVLISSAAGAEKEYRSALHDVSRHFGDDPALSLMLLDHYVNERDYQAAHRALDWLSEHTGGDAALHLLRANISMMEKNYGAVIHCAEIAIHEDSTLEDAYWTLLAVSVYSTEFERATHTLRYLELHFGYAFDPDQIARIKGYEAFASSSAFADWKYGVLP